MGNDVHMAAAYDVLRGGQDCVVFSHRVSWVSWVSWVGSGIELCQFLRIFQFIFVSLKCIFQSVEIAKR